MLTSRRVSFVCPFPPTCLINLYLRAREPPGLGSSVVDPLSSPFIYVFLREQAARKMGPMHAFFTGRTRLEQKNVMNIKNFLSLFIASVGVYVIVGIKEYFFDQCSFLCEGQINCHLFHTVLCNPQFKNYVANLSFLIWSFNIKGTRMHNTSF